MSDETDEINANTGTERLLYAETFTEGRKFGDRIVLENGTGRRILAEVYGKLDEENHFKLYSKREGEEPDCFDRLRREREGLAWRRIHNRAGALGKKYETEYNITMDDKTTGGIGRNIRTRLTRRIGDSPFEHPSQD